MAFKLNDYHTQSHVSPQKEKNIERLLKWEIISFGKKFSNKKKQFFYRELGVLIKAGITIKESLSLILESMKKKSDREMLEQVLKDVINGKPFSSALLDSGSFSEYEFYSLKIGEETGTTAQICYEMASFYERKNEQRRIVLSALTYPMIVIITAVLVVIFMLTYVVPMFSEIFRQNNMELPVLTRAIIKASDFIKSSGVYVLGLIIISVFISGRFSKNRKYKTFIHYVLLKSPVLGKFISKVYLAQFTQAISLLTTAKVPLLNSIQLVKKMIGFTPLQDALDKIELSILKGKSLSESMKENAIFDNRIIALVVVAEETNQTEYIFRQLNEQYNQEVMQQSKLMTTLLEPLVILFVGVIVAILLIAMYLPMFKLSSAIG